MKPGRIRLWPMVDLDHVRRRKIAVAAERGDAAMLDDERAVLDVAVIVRGLGGIGVEAEQAAAQQRLHGDEASDGTRAARGALDHAGEDLRGGEGGDHFAGACPLG